MRCVAMYVARLESESVFCDLIAGTVRNDRQGRLRCISAPVPVALSSTQPGPPQTRLPDIFRTLVLDMVLESRIFSLSVLTSQKRDKTTLLCKPPRTGATRYTYLFTTHLGAMMHRTYSNSISGENEFHRSFMIFHPMNSSR